MEYNKCYDILNEVYSEGNLPVFRNLEKELTASQKAVFANRLNKQVASLLDRSLAANEDNIKNKTTHTVYFPVNPTKVELIYDVFESKEDLVGKQRIKPFESIVTVVCDDQVILSINYAPLADPLKSVVMGPDGTVLVEGSWSKVIKPFFGPTPTRIHRRRKATNTAEEEATTPAAPIAETQATTEDESSVDDISAEIDNILADDTEAVAQ